MPTSRTVLRPPDAMPASMTGSRAGPAVIDDRPAVPGGPPAVPGGRPAAGGDRPPAAEPYPPSPATRLANHGAVLVTPPRRRTFPGRPDQVAVARRFVARELDGCPVTDTAVLLTSELVTNALQHSATASGGRFDVLVWRGRFAACVAVLDDGSDSAPSRRERDPRDHAESGYGLSLVDQLSSRWGHRTYAGATLVWFLLRWSR